ncbi:hypothetical protein WAI453_012737 [Rhynchosporium graminicola]
MGNFIQAWTRGPGDPAIGNRRTKDFKRFYKRLHGGAGTGKEFMDYWEDG